jgi:DMSO/TMAO reductase YedYZ molybdopterin-dependent catalytic subunit
MEPGDAERRKRAAARAARMTLHKGEASSPGSNPAPLTPEQAVSLVHELTLAAWSLAGRPLPRYTRETIPLRIVTNDAD